MLVKSSTDYESSDSIESKRERESESERPRKYLKQKPHHEVS